MTVLRGLCFCLLAAQPALQPEALQPEAPQPGAPQPGAPQPGAPQPGASRVRLPRSGTEAELSRVGDTLVRVALRADFDALLLGIGSTTPLAQRIRAMESLRGDALDETIKRLKRYLERRVRVRFDGHSVPLSVHFPEERRSADGRRLLTLGSESWLVCTIPEGARAVTFFASRSFGPVTLSGFAGPEGRRLRARLEAGQRSQEMAIPDFGTR